MNRWVPIGTPNLLVNLKYLKFTGGFKLTTKQEIVAVRLQDEKGKSHHLNSKATPQRLVARLKCVESELFVYL